MTTNQLKGKKALITGASGGLGLAMAEALGKAGAVINYSLVRVYNANAPARRL